MKILIVSSYLPFPLFSGGHVRLFNLLKELSKKHEVTLVCEKRLHQTERDIQAVKKICKAVYVVERKKQWSVGVIFQTAVSSLPFLLAGHNLPEMQQIISRLLKNTRFDVIHVETFYVYQNLPDTSLPTVLVEHNIEYKVYARFEKTTPIFIRPLLHVDVEKIKYWEKYYWEKATKVVGVSNVEASEIRKDAYVVANGVNLSDFPFKKSTDSDEKTILFMGDFKWIQNKTTAEWIVKEIWPVVEKKVNAKLWIVGKHIPDSLRQYASTSIIFDEHAPDKTSDIYKKADVLLSPIKVGGGTSYKILEAMASGVPVVTTTLGVEGLEAQKNKHALVGETSQELADCTITLLTNKKIYSDITINARKLIEEKYTWDKIASVLEGVYKNAIKK